MGTRGSAGYFRDLPAPGINRAGKPRTNQSPAAGAMQVEGRPRLWWMTAAILGPEGELDPPPSQPPGTGEAPARPRRCRPWGGLTNLGVSALPRYRVPPRPGRGPRT